MSMRDICGVYTLARATPKGEDMFVAIIPKTNMKRAGISSVLLPLFLSLLSLSL